MVARQAVFQEGVAAAQLALAVLEALVVLVAAGPVRPGTKQAAVAVAEVVALLDNTAQALVAVLGRQAGRAM